MYNYIYLYVLLIPNVHVHRSMSHSGSSEQSACKYKVLGIDFRILRQAKIAGEVCITIFIYMYYLFLMVMFTIQCHTQGLQNKVLVSTKS